MWWRNIYQVLSAACPPYNSISRKVLRLKLTGSAHGHKDPDMKMRSINEVYEKERMTSDGTMHFTNAGSQYVTLIAYASILCGLVPHTALTACTARSARQLLHLADGRSIQGTKFNPLTGRWLLTFWHELDPIAGTWHTSLMQPSKRGFLLISTMAAFCTYSLPIAKASSREIERQILAKKRK